MFQVALPLDFAVTFDGTTRPYPLLFSPFSAAGTDCLCKEKSRNLKTYFKALRQRGHHATPFRLRCAPRGTVVPLKVTLGKSVILPRFIKLYLMFPQHRNVCDAPLCGCMSKHFTRSFVAQRFKSAFHVFATEKTFHFSAFDMFAFRSHW